jgi:hypothetical protein
MPVFYDAGFDGKEFSVPAYVKNYDMMPFHELHQKVKGTMPSGELWEAYKSILLVNGTMYRLVALPPGAPQAAVDALRAAVVKLEKDQEYLDEANKVMGDVPEYVTGPTINDDVRRGLTLRPELKEFIEAYAKRVAK